MNPLPPPRWLNWLIEFYLHHDRDIFLFSMGVFGGILIAWLIVNIPH